MSEETHVCQKSNLLNPRLAQVERRRNSQIQVGDEKVPEIFVIPRAGTGLQYQILFEFESSALQLPQV